MAGLTQQNGADLLPVTAVGVAHNPGVVAFATCQLAKHSASATAVASGAVIKAAAALLTFVHEFPFVGASIVSCEALPPCR